MASIMEKTCKCCNKSYPIETFWKKLSNKDGYSNYCTLCNKSGKPLNSYLKPIDLEGELWKDLPDFEGIYMVSNFGRIKSMSRIIVHRGTNTNLPEILMRQCTTKKGYKQFRSTVNYKTKLLFVHICVAKSFLLNPENKSDVNHIDGDKSNNSLNNLEWATRSENLKHAYDTGLRDLSKGKKQRISVVGESITGEIISFTSLKQAYKNGFVFSSIKRNCEGQTEFYKGYKWRYAC